MSEPCYVYAICRLFRGEMVGPVKIGISSKPNARLRELQTGSPYQLTIAFSAMLDSRETALRVERATHEDAEPFAMSGEWFDISPGYAVGLLASGIIFEHGGRVVIEAEHGAALQ